MSKITNLFKNTRDSFIGAIRNILINPNGKIKKKYRKPITSLKNFFIKNLLKKEFNFNQILKLSYKGNLLSGNFILYVVVILTPFLFSYYYFVGRNKYLVSSSIVLRKSINKNNISPSFNSLFAGLTNQASLNESKYLEVYLKSPEIFKKIEKELKFSNLYRKQGIDIFSGISLVSNNDQKYEFYKKQITIFTNQENGITEIKVKAFAPEDALFLNQFLVKQSELFINELNYDISKKQLEFSRKQVNLAKKRLDYEKDRLEKFQTKYKSIDLGFEAKSISKVIVALEEEIIKLKIKLLERKRVFVLQDVPEIKLVENQIKSLSEQIELERQKLVNENEYSLNKRTLELNEINNNILFFEELYKTTLAKTESNRIDSIQQQIFLGIISKPSKPEEPWHIWRHKSFLTYLSLLIILSSISKFIFGITSTHKE